jgi:hypothetical protein
MSMNEAIPADIPWSRVLAATERHVTLCGALRWLAVHVTDAR